MENNISDTDIKKPDENTEPSTTHNSEASDIRLYYDGDENVSNSDTSDILYCRRVLGKLLAAKSRKRAGKTKRKRRVPLRKRRVQKPRTRCQRKSSIVSVKVSSSQAKSQYCIMCGARCIRIRSKANFRQQAASRQKKYKSKRKPLNRGRVIKRNGGRRQTLRTFEAKVIQAGSRSPMLSPLYIANTNEPPIQDHVEEQQKPYTMVTPQMIYEALKRLTMWKQYVTTTDILEYICINYAVNKDLKELDQELRETLRIANLTGLVELVGTDYWCLKSSMQDLTTDHVTLFWTAYVDTLNPLKTRKNDKVDCERKDSQTTISMQKIPISSQRDNII